MQKGNTASNHMNKRIFKILFLLFLPLVEYSQTDYSKEDVYKSWIRTTNRTNTQPDYRFHFDSVVVDYIDNLKKI
jgi:hypothetical protein